MAREARQSGVARLVEAMPDRHASSAIAAPGVWEEAAAPGGAAAEGAGVEAGKSTIQAKEICDEDSLF
jgi:hypothetical protein